MRVHAFILWLFVKYIRCPPTLRMEYSFPHSYILFPSKNIKKFKSLPSQCTSDLFPLDIHCHLQCFSSKELQELTLTHTSTWHDTYSQLDAHSLNDAYRLLICAYSHALMLSASAIISLFLFIPSFLPPPYFGRWLVSVSHCWTFVLLHRRCRYTRIWWSMDVEIWRSEDLWMWRYQKSKDPWM